MKRKDGDGSINVHGYIQYSIGGKIRLRHVLTAERALGHILPQGAQVHHVDGNGLNNAPSNLVVCQDQKYHALLHRRMAAIRAGYPAHHVICRHCRQYDDPCCMQRGGSRSMSHPAGRQPLHVASSLSESISSGTLCGGKEPVNLVDVHKCPVAIDVLWELLGERGDPDVDISHRKRPPYDQHVAFVRSKPYAVWYLLDVEGAWVGCVSMTLRNEIGVQVFRKHRGKGYGKLAVKKLMETTKPLLDIPGERSGCFICNINPRNARSIRMFESLGFSHIQNTYVHVPRSE